MADATCWTLIEGAAEGRNDARGEFSERYLPVIRAYLHARWGGRLGSAELEDAVQDVFVECLREGGALERAGTGRREGFRAFLLGVVRHVALRIEAARARRIDAPGRAAFEADALALEEPTLSRVFDRAWAGSILREAFARQEADAREEGPESARRAALLRLVFQDKRAVADVARQWQVDGDELYREYSRALAEFLRALKAVVAFHHPNSPEAVARECRELIQLFG
jgi:RNA polymerase sigma-70 factor (ECF subfamily)